MFRMLADRILADVPRSTLAKLQRQQEQPNAPMIIRRTMDAPVTLRERPSRLPDLQVELHPYVHPTLNVNLPYGVSEAIRQELQYMAPEGVETGGFLWANELPTRSGPGPPRESHRARRGHEAQSERTPHAECDLRQARVPVLSFTLS